MTLLLVGDGIGNPHNARALVDAAALLGAGCGFRDRGGRLAAALGGIPEVTLADLDGRRVVAMETAPGAAELYARRLAEPARAAVVVGNERRGIAPGLLARADETVALPMPGGLGSINVAAAAGVALWYLTRGPGRPMRVVADPDRARPELLLAGPRDHVEAGSALRSAAALGWGRVLLDDRFRVWFGVDRARTTEGRAAARRARNPIRVVPFAPGPPFDEVVVVVPGPGEVPLDRVALDRGPGQAVVIPDGDGSDWARLGRTVVVAGLGCEPGPARYRLVASIAAAEVARQLGRARRPARSRPGRRPPAYGRGLTLEPVGELVDPAELAAY